MSKSKKAKGRPKQPRCGACKKALYKRMDSGQVKKSDPYAWCRNKGCVRHNQDQTTDGSSRFDVLNEASEGSMEPDAVTKARARIKAVMSAAETQYGSNVVGLALAIVTQELGNHEAANSLIAEYELDKRFGIEPRGADA